MLEIILNLAASPLFYVLVPLLIAWGAAWEVGKRRAR